MKIAHVTATFPPYWAGTGNVAYHNARLLHERGHEVVVFTASTPRDAEMQFPFEVRRLPAVFRIGNAPLTPGLVSALRGFDAIHLHYPFIFGAELTALAARRYRIPLMITYHNDLLAGGARGLIFRAYTATSQPLVLRQADLLLGSPATTPSTPSSAAPRRAARTSRSSRTAWTCSSSCPAPAAANGTRCWSAVWTARTTSRASAS